jgi:hypothetical protein
MSTYKIEELKELQDIKDKIWEFLDNYSLKRAKREPKRTPYADFHWDKSENTGYVSGNFYGLVFLAYQLLMNAASESEETHSHLDEYSGMEEGSDPLIIDKVIAPWDKKAEE